MTLLHGQDSIQASKMTHGLDFYCYYGAGSFQNAAQVAQLFPDKRYVGISPFVTAGIDILDVEKGDSINADIPNHLRTNAKAPNLVLPGFYTSASNVAAANAVCAGNGIARNKYLVFSAHWTGTPHICAPSVCGYPQADLTQYASNADYDSDQTTQEVFHPMATPDPKPVTAIVMWAGTDGPVARKVEIPTALWAQLSALGWKNPM